MTTMAMTVQTPSERDFEAYRQVAVEGLSTRAVARLQQISQTRVCQIVERVLAWLAEELPQAAAGMAEETRVLLAQQIAATRLEHLYREAMDAWRGSRVGEKGEPSAQGNTRYLSAAAQIAAKLAKIPAALLPLASFTASEKASSPPGGDCSPAASEQVATEPVASGEKSVTTDLRMPYGDILRVGNESMDDVFAPVQPVRADESNGRLPLSRQQRRARQKQLDKLRRKAK